MANIQNRNSTDFSDQNEFDDFTTIEDEEDFLVSEVPKIEGEDEETINQRLQYGRDFFQGDIKLDDEQKAAILNNNSNSFDTRTGLLSDDYRWPKDANGNPVIPYAIASTSGYTRNQLQLIRRSMKDIEKFTCIRFITRTNEIDYLEIFSGSGCYSSLGMVGKKQRLSLQQNGCMQRGIIIHELIHAIGYDHMHNHAERDKHVTINWENIEADMRYNFKKVNPRLFGNFGTKYDYLSVMHYDKTSFSMNGNNTIVPKVQRYLNKIGQRKGMSKGDAKRINNMYRCQKFYLE